MGSHPYEDVQSKSWSWGHTRPLEVARESCRNMSLEIFTSKIKVKFLSQEAYLRNLAHSSFDGIRASVYTKNQQITIASQLRVLQQGEAPA